MTSRWRVSPAMLWVVFVLACTPMALSAGCVGCTTPGQVPYPETGAWANLAEPGSGFMLEIQNGRAAGAWFGYVADGSAEWRLLQAPLQLRTGEDGASFWALETASETFSGGACLGCDHASPAVERGDTVEIEFHGRNAGRYRVVRSGGNTAWKPIQSVTFGSDVSTVATETLPLRHVPIPDGDWVFVFQQIVPSMGRQPDSSTYHLYCQAVQDGYPRCMIFEAYPAELLVSGELECDRVSDAGERECRITLDFATDEYRLPLASIGDARMSGISMDGKTLLHAFRVNYE